MKIHYYLGWFNDGIPNTLSKLLDEDITERALLVMVSANPSLFEGEGVTERSWLEQTNIKFEEYHLIDYRVDKEEAQELVQNASAIFLLGGSPIDQNEFIKEYGLLDSIKQNDTAVIIGASAGAINMGEKWLYSKNTGFNTEKEYLLTGIGLDHFSVLSHIDFENNIPEITKALSPLSEEMNVYVSNEDCALRVKCGKIDILGSMHLVSHSQIHKLQETL